MNLWPLLTVGIAIAATFVATVGSRSRTVDDTGQAITTVSAPATTQGRIAELLYAYDGLFSGESLESNGRSHPSLPSDRFDSQTPNWPKLRHMANVDQYRHIDFLRVTEEAALSASKWVGKGKKDEADDAACQAMRNALNTMDLRAKIVIGEGERDEAPMLYIGEELGSGQGPEVQIAVDPLEGTNLCANGTPNAISVLAAAVEGEGWLMHAPDTYMDKLVVGRECRGVVDITLPPRVNVRLMANSLGKDVEEMIIGILDRPRHEALIQELRDAGCRVHLVPDGDLSVAIAALDPEAGIDGLMGVGGAPEGVLTAVACLCTGGEMQARLKFRSEEEVTRAKAMMEGDVERVLHIDDLARGSVVFSATGITSGDLLKGVRFKRGYAQTESIVMRSATGQIRRIETVHQDMPVSG